MIKKIIRLFNSLIINNIKFLFIKIFHFKRFKFHFLNFISPVASIDIQNKGKILFGKKCNILSFNVIGVRENGTIEINDGVFVNKNCQIVAHKKISIGSNVCIGPNTIIMDHDHLFGKNGVEKKKFKSSEIVIGKNVWIGANCVILKGSKIGDNSVIGAGCIINSEIPDNSIVVQKRENTIIKIK